MMPLMFSLGCMFGIGCAIGIGVGIIAWLAAAAERSQEDL